MAIPNPPPDWSQASINFTKRNPVLAFNNSTVKTLPMLSFLFSNPFSLVAKSSPTCSSPVLEDSSIDPPVIQLGLNLQDIRPPPAVAGDRGDLNGLIRGLFRDRRTEELGFKYYEEAREKPGFKPKKWTLKLVIRYLVSSNNWVSIFPVAEDFIRFGVFPDKSTCCRLISSCVKARKFKLVDTLLEAFKSDPQIAVSAFDSAMRGYNKLHMYSSTVEIYERMKSFSIVLDSSCYRQIMESYSKMGSDEKVVALFRDFDGRNFSEETRFHSEIYLILCDSLGRSGRPFEALEFFREMIKKGIPENHSFYSSLICSFASYGEVKMAEDLLKEAENKKMLRNPAMFLKLVLMYVEKGLLEKTLEAVAVMKRVKIRVSDCISCAIVNGFSKKRGLESAAAAYGELLQNGHEPGQVTYASILGIYCRLGLYSKAEEIFAQMEKKRFDKCVVAYSSMITMYGKTGRRRESMKLLAKMKQRGCVPNVWIYNSLLDIHGRASDLRQVEKVWKEMKRRKISPDAVSYTSVISAYSKAGEIGACLEYYEEFRLNGGVIDRALAGIMVGVFSKMNRVDELVKLLRDMKMEGTRLDGRLYRSAFNALKDAGLQIQANWLQESFGAC